MTPILLLALSLNGAVPPDIDFEFSVVGKSEASSKAESRVRTIHVRCRAGACLLAMLALPGCREDGVPKSAGPAVDYAGQLPLVQLFPATDFAAQELDGRTLTLRTQPRDAMSWEFRFTLAPLGTAGGYRLLDFSGQVSMTDAIGKTHRADYVAVRTGDPYTRVCKLLLNGIPPGGLPDLSASSR